MVHTRLAPTANIHAAALHIGVWYRPQFLLRRQALRRHWRSPPLHAGEPWTL